MADKAKQTVQLVCTVLADNVAAIVQALTMTGMAEHIGIANVSTIVGETAARTLAQQLESNPIANANEASWERANGKERKPRAPRAGVSRTVYMLTKHATPERIAKMSLTPQQQTVLAAVRKASRTKDGGLRGGFKRIADTLDMNYHSVDGCIYSLRTTQPPLVVSKTVDPA